MSLQRSYAHSSGSANKGEVVISGAFSVNGSSDPAAFRGPLGLSTDKPNGITSITHTGTGEYTLTFEDQFYACTGLSVHYSANTAADTVAQFNGFSNLGSASSALTCKVTTLTAGSAADITASSGKEVWFTFRFKRTAAK